MSIHGMNLECELCRVITPYRQLYKADDLVYLCLRCFTRLEAVPEGDIKDSIRRFPIKNVV